VRSRVSPLSLFICICCIYEKGEIEADLRARMDRGEDVILQEGHINATKMRKVRALVRLPARALGDRIQNFQ
jgi:hypothetical protein